MSACPEGIYSPIHFRHQSGALTTELLSVLDSIQLFRERLLEKMCTRQSRKVIWDMINTLSNLLLLLSFSIRQHTSMASRAILSNSLEEQWTQNYPQYLSGLSRAPFSDNLSRNSCIHSADLHTVWCEMFEGVSFCGSPFFFSFKIAKYWFFLLGINFCNFQKVIFVSLIFQNSFSPP